MKRPRSVTIIGSLLLLQGLILSFFPGLVLALISAQYMEALPPDIAVELSTLKWPDMLVLVSAVVIGIFEIVSSIGLLRLRAWGWLMAMIIHGIIMIINLAEYARNSADSVNYIGMLLSVIIVLYLNQRHMQQVFDVARYRAEQELDQEQTAHTPEEHEPEMPIQDAETMIPVKEHR